MRSSNRSRTPGRSSHDRDRHDRYNDRDRSDRHDRYERSVDTERDARTVSVTQLQIRAGERDVRKFFASVCSVEDVQLLYDRRGHSKGVAYVELKTLEDRDRALLLSGKPFIFRDGRQGFPCVVQPAFVSSAAAPSSHSNDSGSGPRQVLDDKRISENFRRIYISNLLMTYETEDVRELCTKFGEILTIDLPRNPLTRLPRGFAFVEFSTTASAHKAVQELNGFMSGGQRLLVKPARDRSIKPSSVTTPNPGPSSYSSRNQSSYAPNNAGAGTSSNLHDRHAAREQKDHRDHNSHNGNTEPTDTSKNTAKESTTSWALDDSAANGREGGVNLSSADRLSLMAKLGGGRGSEMLRQASAASLAPNAPLSASEPTPSDAASRTLPTASNPAPVITVQPTVSLPASTENSARSPKGSSDSRGLITCQILISNMFDPSQEEGDSWAKELDEDLCEECSNFGKVVKCLIDTKSPDGRAYIQFSTEGEASKALSVLNGRWFDQRKLQVKFIPYSDFAMASSRLEN